MSIEHIGGFLKWRYPHSWMVFVRTNPINMHKMDGFGVPPFLKTPIYEDIPRVRRRFFRFFPAGCPQPEVGALGTSPGGFLVILASGAATTKKHGMKSDETLIQC